MTQDTQIVLPFASLSGKRLQADFDGGALSSDGGVLCKPRHALLYASAS